jgi:hypothetical protein
VVQGSGTQGHRDEYAIVWLQVTLPPGVFGCKQLILCGLAGWRPVNISFYWTYYLNIYKKRAYKQDGNHEHRRRPSSPTSFFRGASGQPCLRSCPIRVCRNRRNNLQKFCTDRGFILEGLVRSQFSQVSGARPFGRAQGRLWGTRRVIDFEKALATLDTARQHALVLTYRDRVGHAATAAALGCSVRTLAYMLLAARRRLADALDRRDLL